jgi:hypothetical protein
MNKIYITILLLSISIFSKGQNIKDSIIDNIRLTTIAQANQGDNYITFPTDIGNIEPLVFEANLVPSFYIRTSKKAKLIGVLTPQIILRMYQESSFPVRTPSYMPQITAYYKINSQKKVNSFSLFLKLAHHSNGQEDDFYLENGEINLKSGNFATNYLEAGIIKTNYSNRFHAVQFFSTSFESHARGLTSDELIGIYSLYRWNSVFSIFKLPKKDTDLHKKSSISVKGKTTWMFGDVHDWGFFSLNRFNIGFTFFYHPKFLEDIGFFAHFYHGMDYYNIYFDHQITMLRFGIMTEKLRF